MRLGLTIIFVLFLLEISAQSTYAPLTDDYSHLIERYEIKSGSLLKAASSASEETGKICMG